MQKMVTIRRFGVVVGLAAALVGVGGATGTAFADSTGSAGGVIPGTTACPSGYVGVVVSVNSFDVAACTNI